MLMQCVVIVLVVVVLQPSVAIEIICGWLLQCIVVVTNVVVVVVAVTLHCHLLMPTVVAHTFQLSHAVLLAAVAHTPSVVSLACAVCGSIVLLRCMFSMYCFGTGTSARLSSSSLAPRL
jgi:hypothetical protein